MNQVSRLFASICALLIYETASNEAACNLFLAKSNIPGAGRGVYAGKNFDRNDLVEMDMTIVVSENMLQDLSLLNYAYGTADRGYGVAALGAGMIFNHFDDHNADLIWETVIPSALSPTARPYSLFPDVKFTANRFISVGEEITSTYGGASWFEGRGIKMSQPTQPNASVHTLQHLQDNAVCLSHVYVAPSHLPMAGRGLFAAKTFRVGEVVTVSPLLAFPRHLIEDSAATSVLLNYCITSGASDVALLPIGHGSVINHGGNTDSNVKIHWYNWTDQTVMRMRPTGMKVNAEAIVREAFSSIDIAYVATRDIEKGEELLVSYGLEWEAEWRKYLKALEQWIMIYGEAAQANTMPQFRHPIAAPPMFFPLTFYASNCVGAGCAGRKKHTMNFLTIAQSEMFALSIDTVQASLARFPVVQNEYPAQEKSCATVPNSSVDAGLWKTIRRYFNL